MKRIAFIFMIFLHFSSFTIAQFHLGLESGLNSCRIVLENNSSNPNTNSNIFIGLNPYFRLSNHFDLGNRFQYLNINSKFNNLNILLINPFIEYNFNKFGINVGISKALCFGKCSSKFGIQLGANYHISNRFSLHLRYMNLNIEMDKFTLLLFEDSIKSGITNINTDFYPDKISQNFQLGLQYRLF